MELIINHLAPYLPYNVIGISEKGSKFYLSKNSNMLGRGIENRCIDTFLNSKYKLVLRPLSDLTKEIFHNGERFIPRQYFESSGGTFTEYQIFFDKFDKKQLTSLSYNVVQKLLSWHFDVFNLIEKKLAIDINTINHKP